MKQGSRIYIRIQRTQGIGFDQDKWLSIDKGTFHPENSIIMDHYRSKLHLTEIYTEWPAIEELTQTQ